MGRRPDVAWASFIATLFCVALLAGPSFAYADNTTCLACHNATLEFDVGPVDRDSACIACHNAGMVGTHPFHQSGANCGAYCHPGWGQSLLTGVPNYTDPGSGATFASAGSKNTDAATLHIIHSATRWIAGVDTPNSRCASCHAIADCDACHQSAPDSTHATHSSTVQSPWSGTVGHGVVGNDQTVYSAQTESNYCATSDCHNISGTQDNTPAAREDFSHPASVQYGLPENVVTLTPSAAAWRTSYKPVYTLGRMSYSNYANAGLAITFEGEKVALVADQDPYRGIAQVWIDGGLVATVDMYSATTRNQVVVFESGLLAPGTHTIQVRATGTKNPSARHTYVTVDCFNIYSSLPASIAPDCTESCHADKASGHGASFSHEASLTAGTYPAGRFDCADCHKLQLTAEHTRDSSKTKAASCSACHTAYAPYALDTYDYGCSWSAYGPGCHQAANGEQPHNFTDTDHDASGVAGTSECRSCHGNDLSVIHDDLNSGRQQHAALAGNGWATDCLTCHGPALFPTTKDCTDSACHAGSGVVDLPSHPAPPHFASGTDVGVSRTGGIACATCHMLELTSEHGKPTSLTDPGAAGIGCATCHSAGYFPAGWLGAPPASNTCTSCHPNAGGEAGSGHELADFSVKHDWDPPFGNSASCGDAAGVYCHGGTRAWLGDVEMVDILHDSARPGAAGCTSCHDTNLAVPTETACSDCHGSHAATTVAHNASGGTIAANAECLGCHASYASAHLAHSGGCVGCHENTTLNASGTQYLSGAFGMQCTGCHAAGVLGTVYDPTDPNHYPLVNHTADIAADSVATGGAVVTSKACTACHSTELKAEHALTLSAGAIDCIDCHSSTAPVNGAAQVAADWSNDLCSDCHGATHGGTGMSSHDLGDASCAGADCHANTGDLALIHADADTGSVTSCNVCHTSADTSLSSKTTCAGASGCHTAHDLGVHVSSASAECVACHESADVRPVHPGGCSTCHSNGAYPTLPGTNSSECADCHGDEVGAGTYSPTDPNHYDAATHSASAQAGTYASFACTQCHNMEMKPEHITKTSSAFSTVPGTYADKCVACHEVEVDSLGAWNDTCAACHASTHTAQATKHDASAIAAGCGGGGCHDVNDVSVIHNNSVTSNATVTTCATCHVDNTAVPASVDCGSAGCHAGLVGHASVHTAAASDACVSCHEYSSAQAQHAPAVIGASVSGKTNDGCNICHGGDGWTNVRASVSDPECTTCHNGTIVGAHVYGPHDPNHYDPSTAQHTATGTETGISNTGGHTCVTCHYLGMKPEHFKGTTAFDASGYGNDICVACHEIKVDNLGAAWSDECQDCHATASVHTAAAYNAGHDYAAWFAGNVTSCGGANCHNVALADVVHDVSNHGGGDCTSCHNQGVPVQHGCTTCHSSGTHDMPAAHDGSAATIPANGACVGCHASYVDITVHTNACAGCHNNTLLDSDYLNGIFSAACTDCHNDTYDWDGAGAFAAYTYTELPHYTKHLTEHGASPWTAAAQGSGADGAVPAGGKECNTCHTSSMYSAHSNTSTSGGDVTCTECHLDTSLDAAAQVAADWTNDKCTDCHDYGAARTHDAYTSGHLTEDNARGCAESGAGCHGTETNLATLHDSSQSGGAPNYASCDNSGCHTTINARPAKSWTGTDSCGSGSAGCHTDKTTDNHGTKHDFDIDTNDYDNASIAGCTNSGAGCHGADPTGTTGTGDIVDYHPTGAVTCLSGGCHTSSDKASATQPHTCAGCHDGTFEFASDKVALTDAAPGGHYGETTHTAGAMGATVNAGGTYSAACSDCHNPTGTGVDGLYNQHQGLAAGQVSGPAYTDITCSECHNASIPVTLIVTTNWPTGTCGECHTNSVLPGYEQHGSSAPVVNGTEAAGAGSCNAAGCHATLDLHALHKSNVSGNANGCSMSGCHDTSAQGLKPSQTSCGVGGDCHTTDAHDPSAHTTVASSECVECHESADLKVVHGGTCTTCHGNGSYPALPTGKLECTSCHNGTDVGSHIYSPIDANHYTGSEATHTASAAQASATYDGHSCDTCHQMEMKPEHITKTSSAMDTTGYSDKCVDCHEDAVDGLGGAWDDTCSACHATTHTARNAAHDFTTGNAGCAGSDCHDITAVDTLHAAGLPGLGDCTSCHDTSTAVPTESLCTDCHSAHAATATVHASSTTACTDCHTAYANLTNHSGACASCHSNGTLTDYLKNNYTTACTDCHNSSVLGTYTYMPADSNHYDPYTASHTAALAGDTLVTGGSVITTKACTKCHSSELGPEHDVTLSTPDMNVNCIDCHLSSAPVDAASVIASSWPDPKECADCHGALHNSLGSAHDMTSIGCENGCHDTSDLAVLHADRVHSGDSSITSCNLCHNDADTDLSAIALCSDCHSGVHGDAHAFTAASDYADGAGEGVETGCSNSGAGCHGTDPTRANGAAGTYHLSAGCITGDCHSSASFTSAFRSGGDGTDCSRCHEGNFIGAADTDPLSGARTNGHYDVTLHTATAGLGNVTAGGTASASCSVCHDLSLKDAHQAAGFSSKTKGAKVTCGECHGYSANVTTEVKTLNWQNNNCADCHNTTDMGAAQAMHSATTAPVVTGSSTAGCGAAGNGCHSTYNLHTLHQNRGCTLAGCHDAKDKDMTAAVKTCGQASGCHTSATFTSTNHNGKNGDDATKHRAAGNAAASIGGYTQSTACVNCHTLTLKTAHTTRAGWTTPYCLNCHNTTAPVNATNVIKSTAWNNGTCEACHTTKHNTYTAGEHASSAGSGCAIGSCHGASGGSVDVRGLHDKATAGCSASGTDNKGWAGGCHALDKQMTTTAMSCGVGATGLACHTSHTDTNHGGSAGGISCNTSGCHTALTGMVNDTSTYHHVLDSATPYRAPNGGTYPTSTTAMECVSCHLDHSEYSALPGGSGKAFSLRNSATVANPTPANTDDGLCLSCHTLSLARNTTGQKANTITETKIWKLNSTYWTASPHNYAAPGPFNDGSVFNANCAKCHGSLQGTLSSGKFSVHFSPEQRLLNALGDTTVYTINEEQMCFRCHSVAADFVANGGTLPGTPKPSSNVDWYGTEAMGTANVVIYGQMHAGTNTFGHKPEVYANKHLLDEADETQAYINANKHVECADCHNHHAVGDARHVWGTSNLVSEALRGVTGTGYTTMLNTTNYPNVTGAQLTWKSEAVYEYEICFKCHSGANTALATWGGKKFDNAAVNNWTNVAQDFNPGNNSRHPVVSPLSATDPSTSYGTSKLQAAQLIDIWAPGDTMYCSDCHGDSTAPLYSDPDTLNHAQGPHGSAVRYSLRGPSTSWPTKPDGTLITLRDMLESTYTDIFCTNCHPSIRVNKVHTGNTAHKNAACINCHILVPHGGKVSRMIGDRGTMPARLAYQGNVNNMHVESFRKQADPTSYTKNDCNLASGSPCSSHSTGGNASFENW